MSKRDVFFQLCNEDIQHQRMAGCASWQAFSARWRARQGLPLLHPSHVQYLAPQDLCTGRGTPLAPSEQRRLYRAYVYAWAQQEASSYTQTMETGSDQADTLLPSLWNAYGGV